MSIWPRIEEMYQLKITNVVKIQDVYRVQAANASYCLKGYDYPEEEVRFIVRVFSLLEEHGFSRGQKIYRTVEKKPYVRHERKYYTLTNWVDGKNPKFNARGDLKKAMRTLAQFHSAAEGFPAEEAPKKRNRYSSLWNEMSDYKKVLGGYKNTEHLVPVCDEALALLRQPQAAHAIEAEEAVSAFVHGDYNYPNLIKDRQRKIHLVDFENTSLNARMKDLSHILHRNFLWSGNDMLRWIDCYERKRPLGVNDLHLLRALLTAPYPVFRNIRIGGVRHAKSVIPSAGRLKKFQRELKALL